MLLQPDWKKPPDFGPLHEAAGAGDLGALVLTGGETAHVVLRELGAKGIEIRGEAAPGAPWGRVLGGVGEGAVAVTKSGGFGTPPTLAKILEVLGAEERT